MRYLVIPAEAVILDSNLGELLYLSDPEMNSELALSVVEGMKVAGRKIKLKAEISQER